MLLAPMTETGGRLDERQTATGPSRTANTTDPTGTTDTAEPADATETQGGITELSVLGGLQELELVPVVPQDHRAWVVGELMDRKRGNTASAEREFWTSAHKCIAVAGTCKPAATLTWDVGTPAHTYVHSTHTLMHARTHARTHVRCCDAYRGWYDVQGCDKCNGYLNNGTGFAEDRPESW